MQFHPRNIALLRVFLNGEAQYLWGEANSLGDDSPLCPLSPALSFSINKFRDFHSHASTKPITFLGNLKAEGAILNPLPAPNKTICTALNYPSHIKELSQPQPNSPTFFAKHSCSLTSPYSQINLPTKEMLLDNEVELGVVIGDNIPWRTKLGKKDVENKIFGFVLINDLTSRELLVKDNGVLWRSKNLPKSTPVGPFIIPTETMRNLAEFIEPGTPTLKLTSTIERTGTAQIGSTNEMLFSVMELINKILEATNLNPGDLLFTGTPGGTGFRITKLERIIGQLTKNKLRHLFLKKQVNSPRYLKPGDIVTVEGEWLGAQKYLIKEGT